MLYTISLQVNIKSNLAVAQISGTEASTLTVAQDPHGTHANIFRSFKFTASFFGSGQSINETKDILYSVIVFWICSISF